ncbi:MAG TPA: AAA family ATPase, partial [Candidatus Obscuribacterales bacterium]
MPAAVKEKGIVLGKFLPPHRGHLYVIDFARNFVEDLSLVVESCPYDVIPLDLRLSWLQELYPQTKISVMRDFGGPDGAQNKRADGEVLSETIAQRLIDLGHGSVDYIFGSEDSLGRLAAKLGATYIPVDPCRTILPVSGEKLRNDPMSWWQYMPRCVRPHFVRRVCVFGPESTGKSTLAENLARHFNTVAVPEWARVMLSSRDDKLLEEDLPLFAHGQIASEDALALDANRILFCDTDAIVTMIWSNWIYGRCHPSVVELAERRQYDLYLLTDVDVPWVEDPQRYLPDDRQAFFERCVHELESRGRKYVIIKGDWDQRFASAVDAVERLCLR